MRIPLAAMLVASPFAFAFIGSSNVAAQNCGGGTYGGYDPQPRETVTVVAPQIQSVDHARLNTPPGRITASKTVSFADLDLCTSQGARELRARARQASEDVCNELEGIYPHGLSSDVSCYRNARARVQPKVDFAIGNARGTR